MRKSLLLYLFVFAALLAVYFYVTGQRALESQKQEISQLRTELEKRREAVDSLSSGFSPDRSFSLLGNEEALTYFEQRGFDPLEIIKKVEGEIIGKNLADADNELVPYEGMEGFFRVNKVKLLNHKWAIASFTDGVYWGEIFLVFEVDDSGNLEITTEKALLYPSYL